MTVAGRQTCGLSLEGEIRCWGPFLEPGGEVSEATYVDLYLRDSHSLFALTKGGELHVYADPAASGLGPFNVLGDSIEAIAGDQGTLCAIENTGVITCWFSQSFDLGVQQPLAGRTVQHAQKVVVGASVRYPDHSLEFHACGLHDDGWLTCMGDNDHGQIEVPRP